MDFSEDRRSHLSHLILEALRDEGFIEFDPRRKKFVLNEIKRVFEREHQLADQIDNLARKKIDSLSRLVPPGSPEWEVLYRKYYEEESQRLRRDG